MCRLGHQVLWSVLDFTCGLRSACWPETPGRSVISPAYSTGKRCRLATAQHVAVQSGARGCGTGTSRVPCLMLAARPCLLAPTPPRRRPRPLPLPMRCALSMACSSVVGFHHRSISTTWLATVRFTPRAAALRDTWRKGTFAQSITHKCLQAVAVEEWCRRLRFTPQGGGLEGHLAVSVEARGLHAQRDDERHGEALGWVLELALHYMSRKVVH